MTQKARQDLLRPLIFAVEKARHLWFFASTMKPPPVDRTYSIDVNRFFWRAVRTGQSTLSNKWSPSIVQREESTLSSFRVPRFRDNFLQHFAEEKYGLTGPLPDEGMNMNEGE